jgi:hypothetical protein
MLTLIHPFFRGKITPKISATFEKKLPYVHQQTIAHRLKFAQSGHPAKVAKNVIP